jgi:fucose permease
LHDATAVDGHHIDPHTYDRRWAILVVLCTSLMIVIIGNTALNVAIPTLARELDASTTDLQSAIAGAVVVALAAVIAQRALPRTAPALPPAAPALVGDALDQAPVPVSV